MSTVLCMLRPLLLSVRPTDSILQMSSLCLRALPALTVSCCLMPDRGMIQVRMCRVSPVHTVPCMLLLPGLFSTVLCILCRRLLSV